MQPSILFVLHHSETFLKISRNIIIYLSHSGGMYTDATKKRKHSNQTIGQTATTLFVFRSDFSRHDKLSLMSRLTPYCCGNCSCVHMSKLGNSSLEIVLWVSPGATICECVCFKNSFNATTLCILNPKVFSCRKFTVKVLGFIFGVVGFFSEIYLVCYFCWLRLSWSFFSVGWYNEQSTEFDSCSFPQLTHSRLSAWVQSLVR